MSDETALIVVLFLVYFSDCCLWVPKNSLVFLSWINHDWHHKAKKGLLASSTGELVLLNPFPPLGTVILSDHPPFSVSPQGLVAQNTQALVFSDEATDTPPVFLFERMESTGVRDRDILINQKPFCQCTTSHQARELRHLLESIRLMDEGGRDKKIEEFYQAHLNCEAARKMFLQTKPEIKKLRLACNLLFAYLFILFPLLIIYFEFGGFLIPCGVAAFLLAQFTCWLFFSSHKKIFPNFGEERITHVVKMALCPPAAVRAGDLLSETVLRNYNPIVVAHILLPHDRFMEFAFQTIRGLAYPNISASTGDDAIRVIEWHNKVLVRLFTRYLSAQAGIQENKLSPPKPNDLSIIGYCPRCLSQYSVDRG